MSLLSFSKLCRKENSLEKELHLEITCLIFKSDMRLLSHCKYLRHMQKVYKFPGDSLFTYLIHFFSMLPSDHPLPPLKISENGLKCQKNGLMRKKRLILKFMTSQPPMKFWHLIEYNIRNIFLEKPYTKCVGETIPRLFPNSFLVSLPHFPHDF